MNRDIMIRNVALILAFAIFSAWGPLGRRDARRECGALQHVPDRGLFPRRVRHRRRDALRPEHRRPRRAQLPPRVRLSLGWSLGFGLAVSGVFLIGGGFFIDFVSTNPDVRVHARDYLVFAALTPLFGAAAFAFDGIYTGATWTRSMRDPDGDRLRALRGAILLAAGESRQHGSLDRASRFLERARPRPVHPLSATGEEDLRRMSYLGFRTGPAQSPPHRGHA